MEILNKFYKKGLAIILIMLVSPACNKNDIEPAESTTFIKLLGGKGNDNFIDVLEYNNACYALGTSTSSFGNETSNSFLVKTDMKGNFIWQKLFVGYGGGTRKLLKINDGFIIFGSTAVGGTNNKFYTYALKINYEGDIIWRKIYNYV